MLKQLDTAGGASPKAALTTAPFGDKDDLMVFEVWDSQTDFDAFFKILLPILNNLGVDPGYPTVMPIHNTIAGWLFRTSCLSRKE